MPPEQSGSTAVELASVVRPAGTGAALIADLWWVMFWIATVVCVIVFVLLLIAVARRRSGGQRVEAPADVPRSEGAAVDFPPAGQPPAWSNTVVLTAGVLVDRKSVV